jgi:hypothetical protein
MRHIMRTFDEWKKSFSSQSDDIKFYVPEGPLWEVSIKGKLQEGELTIPRFVKTLFHYSAKANRYISDHMMKFFNHSVNSVLGLINGQRMQAEDKSYRVKVGNIYEPELLQLTPCRAFF